MSNRQQMSNADAAWLHMDRPTNLMVITSVMWFDEPLDRERVREVFAERMVEPYVRFRQRAVESALPLRGPHWEDDPDFDIGRHIHHRALPAPGGPAELQEMVSELMATPMDRAKPLWDLYLVDGYGEGSAMVSRMHHCIADGIALARVMLSMTDEHPDAGITPVSDDHAQSGGRVEALVHSAMAPARTARDVTAALLRETAEALVHPSAEASHLGGEAARDARALRKMLLTGSDAQTVLKGKLGATRSAAWSAELDLDEIKAIGHNADATVNDVLVAALVGGLRDYLRRRGTPAPEIRAMVPFNLRPLDQPLPSTLGNDFGLVYLPLPVGIRSARERLAAVKRAMDDIKSSPEGPIAYGILGLVGLTPVDIERLVVDLFTAKASMVLTNVPGPRQTVYLAGTPVRGVLVWAPTSGSVAMSLSIISYAGHVTVGVMSDAHLVPDPERIAAGFERELGRLRRAYLRAPAVR
ncbi:MAG: WS/DGAT/MGAT family O-acyltransferase [Solirubrobacteraceae bacterium]